MRLLRLLHLADSALPIGGMAHAFGIETLAAEGSLDAERLPQFLEDYLAEAGAMDAAFCRAAHALAGPAFSEEKWLDLNRRRSALQPARESRSASAALGRRFLELASGLPQELNRAALQIHPLPARRAGGRGRPQPHVGANLHRAANP